MGDVILRTDFRRIATGAYLATVEDYDYFHDAQIHPLTHYFLN